MKIRLARALAALLVASSAGAQGSVWVVDQGGGPGSQFVAIGPAVAAASDGDLVLVRDGTYLGFTVLAKQLSIAADVGASPVVGLSAVELTSSLQDVVMRGLRFETGSGACTGPGLYVDFAAGPLWLEHVAFGGCRGLWINAPTCSAVAIRCATDTDAFAGMRLTSGTLHLQQSVASGTDGTPTPHGLDAQNGSLFLDGCALRGADGEVGDCLTCSSGGDGGDGLQLFGGAAVWARDTLFLHGTGGPPCCPGSGFGADGVPVRFLGGTLVTAPGPSRSLVATSPVPAGGSTTLTIDAEPGDVVFVLYSRTQLHGFLPAFGSLLVGASFQLVPLGAAPTGSLTQVVPLAAPPPGTFEELFLQLGVLSAGGTPSLGSGSVLHVLGP